MKSVHPLPLLLLLLTCRPSLGAKCKIGGQTKDCGDYGCAALRNLKTDEVSTYFCAYGELHHLKCVQKELGSQNGQCVVGMTSVLRETFQVTCEGLNQPPMGTREYEAEYCQCDTDFCDPVSAATGLQTSVVWLLVAGIVLVY